jgi:hypothetical protein
MALPTRGWWFRELRWWSPNFSRLIIVASPKVNNSEAGLEPTASSNLTPRFFSDEATFGNRASGKMHMQSRRISCKLHSHLLKTKQQNLPQVRIELRTEDPLGMRIGKSAETFCGRTAKPRNARISLQWATPKS